MLSEELRDELAGVAPRRECDRLAELSGLFHTAGSAHFRGRGEIVVGLDVASASVARRAFSLLRSCGIAAELRTYRQPRFDRRSRFQLDVAATAAARRVLHAAGVLDARARPLDHPPKRVTGRGCCRGAYLRGALLGSGSLTGAPHPHLEIRFASVEGAAFIAAVAAQERATLRVLDRGRHALAYAKGLDDIAELLGAAGANHVVLALEERAVIGATRAAANRQSNADHANLVRASRAAHAQLRAVRLLDESGQLERLSPELREAAALRVRHPALALRELARKCDPPTSKAACHRRLRRLVELAESAERFPR